MPPRPPRRARLSLAPAPTARTHYPGQPRGAVRPRAVLLLDVAGVETAFLQGLLFPPPAAFALVLAGVDGARAGFAADRVEAAIVERVVRHLVLADVGPHLA